MAKKSGLSARKASKIMHDHGFTRLGDGYDSEKQRRYIAWVARGSRKPKSRRK